MRLTHTSTNQSAIIPGDATGKTMDQIIMRYTHEGIPLASDLLLACHHGAETHRSNDPHWVGATHPKAVIMSAGIHGYHHPKCAVVENYSKSSRLHPTPSHAMTCYNEDIEVDGSLDRAILSTKNSGNVIAHFLGSHIHLESERGVAIDIFPG